ncbi:MAG: hypothetical protein M1813_008433 [Trichoglossum hirsutum]|nr:MAG: hypothetical protein M1813_008433 [Trichoglossum hirsutum]
MADQPELPDFAVISQMHTTAAQTHATLAYQLSLCENIPAMDGGVAIAGQLAALSNTTNNLTVTLTDLVNTVGGLTNTVGGLTNTVGGLANTVGGLTNTVNDLVNTVNGLGDRLRASETNASARNYNSRIFEPSQTLEPLVNVVNGAAIPGFPETGAALSAKSSADLTTILVALGVPEFGDDTPAAKKQRLRRIVGLSDIR